MLFRSEAIIQLAEKTEKKITQEFINEIVKEEIANINKELPAFKQIKRFHIQDKEFEKTTTQKIKRYLIDNSTNNE